MAQRFEMLEDGSSKFWEIDVQGASLTVRFGRIGSAGQTKTTEFASEAAAASEASKLIRQKTQKGYAEVGASSASSEAAPAAKAAKAPRPKQVVAGAGEAASPPAKDAERSSTQSRGDAGPSSTPRTGSRTWVRPPGGGRDWLGTDLDDTTRVVGRWAVSWLADGRVVRFDLGSCEHTELGKVLCEEQSYRAVTISLDGVHWAVTDGSTCTIDGVAVAGTWDMVGQPWELVFAHDSQSLWGFRGQKVVKLDLSGQVLWEGAQRGAKLALAGEQPVVGFYGEALLPDGSGDFVRVSASHEAEPRELITGGNFAVLLFWLQHEETWCWRASVFSLLDRSERTYTLPGFDGCATIEDRRLIWAGGELELESGALSSFEVVALGSKYEQKRYGGIALSPDKTTLWQLLLDGSCVRRFARSDRSEPALAGHHSAQVAWSLAVSRDGLVAVGTDTGWMLLSPTKETLHESHDGQAVQLAFSPDGTRLAVATTTPSIAILDVASLKTVVQAERGAGSTLAFSPDGQRLLLLDDKDITLVGASDLQDQAVLKGKSTMSRAAWSEGAIVAADQDGRAYVFDDPGPLPAAKKAPKHPPRVMVPSPDLARDDGAVLELSAGHLVVSSFDEVRALDLGSRKVVAKSAVGRVVAGDGVVAIPANGAVSLYRLGERTPFATLEGMPDHIAATPDGRRVVASLHRGVLLWTEEGGRTPATNVELVLPSAGPVEAAPLAGFSQATRAFVLHGFAVQVPRAKAESLARDVTTHFPSWVAIPEGDPQGAGLEVPLNLFVGVVIAEAEADGVQGTKGEKASFDVAAFEHAAALVLQSAEAVQARLSIDATSIEPARDHLVATGALSSAELVMGRTKVRLGWEDYEQSAALSSRGAGTLVAWYD